MALTVTCIKMTLLGESTTGKTSIAHRFVKEVFPENPGSTIGSTFMTLRYENVKYEIWDTAGQERYLSLLPLYYRGSDLVVLVYDLSRSETQDKIVYYLDKIVEQLTNYYRILIIGNKLDLINKEDLPAIGTLLVGKLNKYEMLYDRMEFINVSTKTGENFKELVDKFREIGKLIVNKKTHKVDEDIVKLETPRSIIITSFKNAYGDCSC